MYQTFYLHHSLIHIYPLRIGIILFFEDGGTGGLLVKHLQGKQAEIRTQVCRYQSSVLYTPLFWFAGQI